MCGIVGIAGNIYEPSKKALNLLMYLNYMRGKHSVGINTVLNPVKRDEAAEIKTIKSLGHTHSIYIDHPDDFTSTNLIKGDPRYVIAHNRAATIGNVTLDNAHPFEHGEIIGVHNGTLHKYNLDKLDDHDQFETDSEAIYYNIALHGYEKTIPKLHGAYALVWYDNNTRKLHFIRNKERTLYYAETSTKCLLWSSDKDYLELAMKKSKLQGEIKLFEDDVMYTFDTEAGYKDMALVKGDKIEGYKPVYAEPVYINKWLGWQNNNNNVYPFYKKKVQVEGKKLQRELVGKGITFSIGSLKILKNGLRFREVTSNQDGVAIKGRVFDPDMHLTNCEVGDFYTCEIKKIKRCKVTGEEYFLCNLQTIELFSLNVQPNEPELFKGYGNELLDKYQYMKKLECKCANCQSDEELGKAEFFQRDEWLCQQCVTKGLMIA